MATNPITSEELTINFTDLMKIPVSDRVQAATLSNDYVSQLLNALTPIQMAKVFPDYYRQELPDISNFILANRYLDDRGAAAFDQKYGGEQGKDYEVYDSKDNVPSPPKSVVDQILENAHIAETVDGVVKRDEGGRGELGFTQDTTMDPKKRALLDAIATDSGGGYGTINYVGAGQTGISQTSDFSKHPFEGQKGYTASGRYQILATNYEKFAKKLGLYDYEKKTSDFSPEAQDRVAYEMAKDVYRVGTGGRSLDEDIKNPNFSPEQLIRPLSIDYGWHILKTDGGIQNAVKVFKQNEPIYVQDVETAKEEAKKIKPEETVEISKEVTEILNTNPTAKKYFFEEKPEMAQKLQRSINAGTMSIEDLNKLVKQQAGQIKELVKTTENMATIGGDAIVNEEQTRINEQQEKLAGTRKLPLREDLTDVMDYAAQKISEESGKNIYMKVFSGGQAALGTSGPRTGSTEHDLGGAADVYFIERLPDGTERTLSMKNPDDKKLMYQAAYHFSRAGGRSVGLESGYMGDESMHLGISRNNEDPVHHGDPELQAIVDQGKNEFLTEARNSGWDLRYGYKNFIEKQRAERVAAYEEAAKISEKNENISKPIVESIAQTSEQKTEPIVQAQTENAKQSTPEIVPQNVETVVEKQTTIVQSPVETPIITNTTAELEPSNDKIKPIAENRSEEIYVENNITNQIAPSAEKETKVAAVDNVSSEKVDSEQVASNIISPVASNLTAPVLSSAAVPVEVKEQNKTENKIEPIPEVPVPTYQYGGTPKTQDDENLRVYDEDGSLRWKMNSGEGIYIKPEADQYADSKMEELSGRLDEMSAQFDSQSSVSDQVVQNRPPERRKQESNKDWSNKVVTADRPRSPSADRANRRSKFLNEGWRAGGWGSPNSITS